MNMSMVTPSIGSWFSSQNETEIFEVVAVDETAQTIEIQYIDGAIHEYDFVTWQTLALQPAAAPEDWRAPFELNNEDAWCDDRAWRPDNWSGVLTQIEPDSLLDREDFEFPS